jgi:hypothetical protein
MAQTQEILASFAHLYAAGRYIEVDSAMMTFSERPRQPFYIIEFAKRSDWL